MFNLLGMNTFKYRDANEIVFGLKMCSSTVFNILILY